MKKLAVIVLVMFSAAVFADEAEVPERCAQIYVLAASAMQNRDDGKSEESLRRALPALSEAEKRPESDEAFITRAMHEIVTEVFAMEGISQPVYSTYRAERCTRESSGLVVSNSFSAVSSALAKCSKKRLNAAVTCAMKLAGSSSVQ